MSTSQTLNASQFGLAAAITTAIFWVVCVGFILIAPRGMMNISGHMMHADVAGYGWHMGFGGLIIGGLMWTIIAGAFFWAMASIYNRLI